MSRITRILALATLLMTLVITGGCSLFGGADTELKDVSDYSGVFHFQVPADWQVSAESGAIAVYASQALPTAETAIESLSILVFTSYETTVSPAAEQLKQFAEDRSTQRGWVDPVIGDVSETEIGGRPAYQIEIEASNPDGPRFAGRFLLVKTSGRDVLVIAVAPADQIDGYDGDIDSVMENWFWHVPADSRESIDSTGTGL